ncbi:hypothetical protein AVEN_243531-1 [Araneus ventricosus]|uniref:Uncharacterized protein n=1 Tax=Araneus ventricosus TaxID=182803 RepID=A0A4Y2NVQ9_ARAVE|nr:hypothetical protein AVEN_243531-1 [Araneus ventricosus]
MAALGWCSSVVVVSYSTCSSPQLDQVQESARRKSRRTIHAGYNGMAFTPWVTLRREKTPDLHRPFNPGPPPHHDEAA